MNVTIGSLELYFHSFYVPRTWRIGTFVGAESRVFFGGVSDQVDSTYITAATVLAGYIYLDSSNPQHLFISNSSASIARSIAS